MGEIIFKSLRDLAFFVVLFSVGILWAITLIGITLMTARELWLGHRQKHRRKELNP